MYQEIATGFALAMTYKPSAGSSHGVRLYHKINKIVPTMNGGGAAASRPPYGDGSQNHDKMCCVILYKML